MDSDEARRARAAQRASWPVAVQALRDPTNEAKEIARLLATTTAGERIAMVWRLTQDAWAMSGRAMPDYKRSEAPGRVVRKRPPA